MVTVLPVAPWLGAALLLVLVVALNVPVPQARRRASLRVPGSPLTGRSLGPVAVLVAGAAALLARLGPPTVLDNPVPALVVGLGWPLLLLVPALAGLVLLARRPTADDEPEAEDAPAPGPRDVRPAVVAAAAVSAYLALVRGATDPRTLAVALGAYVLVLLAVGVAGGREAAARTEVLGLLGRWAALGPRLGRWHPPRGASAVLAVVLAGAWVERAQRTSAWFELAPRRTELVLLVLVASAVAGLGAAALLRWSDGHPAPVLVPLVVGAVVAGVLRRALISAQLLWDQAGLGTTGYAPDPLGVVGGQAAALAVVALAGCAAAAVLARRTGPGAARLPGTAVVLVLTGVNAALALLP